MGVIKKTKTLQQRKIFCYNKTDSKEFFYQQYKDIEDKKYYILEYRIWDDLKSSILIVSGHPFKEDFLCFDFLDNVAVREAVIKIAGILYKPIAVTDKGIIYSGGTVGMIVQSKAEDGYMYFGELL